MRKVVSLVKRKSYTREHGFLLLGATMMAGLYGVSSYVAYTLSLSLGT